MSKVRLINKTVPDAAPPAGKLQLEAVNNAFVVQDSGGNIASFSGVNTGDQTSETLPVIATLDADYTTLQDLIDTQLSTGIVGDAELITDVGDGTINVAESNILMRVSDDDAAEMRVFKVPAASGLELTDGSLNYVYANFPGSTAEYEATTTERTDTNTNVLIGTVYRNGTDVHINNNFRVRANDNLRRVALRFVETMPFARAAGGIVSEVGARNLHITAGRWWECTNPFTTPAFDSSDSDTFVAAYSDGSDGWTEQVAQTQIDNAHYDDLTGTLAEALPNRYLTRWVYLETDGHVIVVYGRAQHVTEALAEAEAEPPRLPRIQASGRLLARIIIQVGASAFTSIKNVDAGMEFTSPTTHNGLGGLQGGETGFYGHLTQAEHAELHSHANMAALGNIGDSEGGPTWNGLPWPDGGLAAVEAHEQEEDPHPQYTTEAEASAAAPVQSVAGKTGAVSLVKADVGLGNVDNTSDADKPISTATQAALDTKADLVGGLIPITQIPPAAIERLVVVADEDARFALTTATVQNGDTVKQNDTGLMYFVVDDSNLDSEAGYEEYTAGQAASVAWANVTGKPDAIDAIDGLTPAANKLPYYTGGSSAALADFTAAGRALLGDADADAQLNTLGGSAVGKAVFKAADEAAAQSALGLGSAAVANILGTVSQSGGVPTGAIIESGSNANGEYVRFADGAQICTAFLSFEADTPTQLSAIWQFPAAFSYGVSVIGSPTLTATPNVRDEYASLIMGEANIYAVWLLLKSADGLYQSGDTQKVYFVAIGRWF